MNRNEHGSLYHYTNLAACKSILDSNKLWASHYFHTNDSSELILSRYFILHALKEVNRTDNPRATEEFLDTMIYKQLLPGAYIASFCEHPQKSYKATNGLLSMWRGYGNTGGVCIIFNKNDLKKKFYVEMKNENVPSISASVVYKNNDEAHSLINSEKFSNHLNSFKKFFKYFCEQRTSGNIDNAFKYIENNEKELAEATLALLFRIKHKGFREENEYRFGIFNAPQSLPPKTICTNRDNGIQHHIELDLDLHSTIERIIIGPGRSQKEVEYNLKKYINDHIAELTASDIISCSETPYSLFNKKIATI